MCLSLELQQTECALMHNVNNLYVTADRGHTLIVYLLIWSYCTCLPSTHPVFCSLWTGSKTNWVLLQRSSSDRVCVIHRHPPQTEMYTYVLSQSGWAFQPCGSCSYKKQQGHHSSHLFSPPTGICSIRLKRLWLNSNLLCRQMWRWVFSDQLMIMERVTLCNLPSPFNRTAFYTNQP